MACRSDGYSISCSRRAPEPAPFTFGFKKSCDTCGSARMQKPTPTSMIEGLLHEAWCPLPPMNSALPVHAGCGGVIDAVGAAYLCRRCHAKRRTLEDLTRAS